MEDVEVYLDMKVELPFRRKKGRPLIDRTLIIEKNEVIKSEGGTTWPIDFDVNFFVEWAKGDRRDEAILAGHERKQNVYVDVRRVLLALQRMFPELNIAFTAHEDYELLLEKERAKA